MPTYTPFRALAAVLLTMLLQPTVFAQMSGNEAAKNCLIAAKLQPKSGNSVVDTRCSLVAFEVCMNKAAGTISQSQDAQRQCAMMKQIGGANACLQPCIEALVLPVGGNGVVGRYTGLTTTSVDCYNNTLKGIDGKDEAVDECRLNGALACLQNASASPVVNAAILRERKSACKSYSQSYPRNACGACVEGRLWSDYEEQKKHDVLGVDVLPAK